VFSFSYAGRPRTFKVPLSIAPTRAGVFSPWLTFSCWHIPAGRRLINSLSAIVEIAKGA
jgi:hypothetical protein